MSSISGISASAGSAAYGAAKAAVIQMTQTHAMNTAPDHIRVNCVAPGSIEFPGGVWDHKATCPSHVRWRFSQYSVWADGRT